MGCLEPSECVLGQAVPPVCVYMYVCETCQARDAPAKFFQPPVCAGRGGVAGRPVCMHNNVGETSARLVFVQSSVCIISWQKCRSERFFCFLCVFSLLTPPPQLLPALLVRNKQAEIQTKRSLVVLQPSVCNELADGNSLNDQRELSSFGLAHV